jgi:hypothetical protein
MSFVEQVRVIGNVGSQSFDVVVWDRGGVGNPDLGIRVKLINLKTEQYNPKGSFTRLAGGSRDVFGGVSVGTCRGK